MIKIITFLPLLNKKDIQKEAIKQNKKKKEENPENNLTPITNLRFIF